MLPWPQVPTYSALVCERLVITPGGWPHNRAGTNRHGNRFDDATSRVLQMYSGGLEQGLRSDFF